MMAITATAISTLMGNKPGKRRGNLRNTCRDRHGNRQNVVGEQRRARDLRREFPQIIPCDDVSTAAIGIGVDRLSITERHNRQQYGNRNRDRD